LPTPAPASLLLPYFCDCPCRLKKIMGYHTTKNIYGNVNYAKILTQGTVMNVFDCRVPGGEE
jgi:hypothetical protein